MDFSFSGTPFQRVVGFFLEWQKLNIDGSLFCRFYGIWETEVEGSIQSF